MMTIQPLSTLRYEQWRPLWQDYLTFYQSTFDDEIAAYTWSRLTDQNHASMYGFAACEDANILGIVHVIEHESCWTLRPYAYLQDLFVNTEQRGKGVGRALIEHVYQITKQRHCDRVYWLTQQDNLTAQHLYDRIAKKTGFIQYKQPL